MSQVIHSACPMDCPDTCAVEAVVDNGTLISLNGSFENPVTAGFICGKVRDFAKRQYHPDRILYPLRRSGVKGSGRFERISWEEALSEITDRFRRIKADWGGEAILPFHYGGSNGFLGDDFLDDLYFTRLGASQLQKTVCAVPTTLVAAGMYGKMPGVAFEDYPLANFILIWGANPKASNIHLVPFLKKAKQNGAFIAVIDPRNNFSEKEIDLHLPVLPGADLPLALSMIHYWRQNDMLDDAFLSAHAKNSEKILAAAEEWTVEKAARVAGVDTAPIRQLAERFAASSPALLRCGWGVERNRNGGQAIAAILAMPALLGKFGLPGGGYTMSSSGAVKLQKEKILGYPNRNTRQLNMSRLGQLLTTDLNPPLKALFVYNCNPVATVPNQSLVVEGLKREDLFTVVHEQVMTDTARFADIILPATTFLEYRDLRRSYGNYFIGRLRPVLSAAGEALPNEQMFARLAKTMGFKDPAFQTDTQTLMKQVAENLETGEGTLLETDSGHIQVRFEKNTPVQFKTVFPQTADGKIDLCPPQLGSQPYRHFAQESDQYPLVLITPSSSRLISSTFGEFNLSELQVTMHPEDAARRHVADGERVRTYNQFGEVICTLRVSAAVRPGVVSMPKGAWRKSAENGWTANALCPDHVQVVGGAACYNDARVEVEKF